MDSFSVSIYGGASLKKVRVKSALLVGSYFGLFQGAMFAFGYIWGGKIRIYIDTYDHWVALAVLVFIGGRMIIESFNEKSQAVFSLDHKTLLMLAVVTSIDALGVGFSSSLLNGSLIVPSVTIGIVAFLFSAWGLYLGKTLKKLLKKKAEFFGGIILIGIGINILIEHGVFY